jgi:HlyD family secretion protein
VSSDTAKPVSKKKFLPVIILLLLGFIYAAYHFYLASKPFEWSGTVEARTILVGSRAGGRVKEVAAKEGDQLKAGETLIVLEAGDWQGKLLEAQGQLDQAKANLEKLERGTRREQVDQALARLDAQQVIASKAQLDADRMHQLLSSGAATQADVDAADATLKGAQAMRDALRNQFAELKNGTRIEDIKIARAQVNAAQGCLDQIQAMIDELTIKAPKDVRVEALDLRPGDILAPNASAATLLEDNQLYVRIYVPETVIGRIAVGQKVPITVDSFPDQSFEGVVEYINHVGEYSPRNLQTSDERADQVFATRIGIKTGADKLRAGMAAFIQVPQ